MSNNVNENFTIALTYEERFEISNCLKCVIRENNSHISNFSTSFRLIDYFNKQNAILKDIINKLDLRV